MTKHEALMCQQLWQSGDLILTNKGVTVLNIVKVIHHRDNYHAGGKLLKDFYIVQLYCHDRTFSVRYFRDIQLLQKVETNDE